MAGGFARLAVSGGLNGGAGRGNHGLLGSRLTAPPTVIPALVTAFTAIPAMSFRG